ncbi:hypothetical protein C0Q70_17139 [Pomacea canaliculata]|uniref:Uncharacterized protein n=1 Tax=Pomacea canaliculata TaxID=400727 RepID=A0A2T7NRR3_POMCA|nr:hypothetical protein C0Q70_17139 [Pomacea canaliculata]
MDTREKNVLIEVKKRHVTPLSYSRHFRSRRFSFGLIVSYTVHRGKIVLIRCQVQAFDRETSSDKNKPSFLPRRNPVLKSSGGIEIKGEHFHR